MRLKNLSMLLALSLLIFSSQLMAQEDSTDYATENKEAMAPPPPKTPAKPKTPIKEKIYFGGNLGLSFGTVTSIAIEPLIGWKWTPKLSSGLVLSYWYYKDSRSPFQTYESSSYGYRLFSRYRVIPQAYVHVEWAQFFYEDRINNLDFSSDGSGSVPYLFVGGGLSQPMGSRAHFFVQILYELLQSDYSIYRSSNDVFISVGVAAGF